MPKRLAVANAGVRCDLGHRLSAPLGHDDLQYQFGDKAGYARWSSDCWTALMLARSQLFWTAERGVIKPPRIVLFEKVIAKIPGPPVTGDRVRVAKTLIHLSALPEWWKRWLVQAHCALPVMRDEDWKIWEITQARNGMSSELIKYYRNEAKCLSSR